MSPADFVRQGYRVQPATNGGFVVETQRETYTLGSVAAFTTFSDLLEWLTAAHVEAANTQVRSDAPATE